MKRWLVTAAWIIVAFVVALGYSPWLGARSNYELEALQGQVMMLESRIAMMETQQYIVPYHSH